MNKIKIMSLIGIGLFRQFLSRNWSISSMLSSCGHRVVYGISSLFFLTIIGTVMTSQVFFVVFFFFAFLWPHIRDMEGPCLRLKSELRLPSYTTPTATWDLSHIFDLHTAHSNARSPAHWARAGIKPTSSRILVRFVSTAPQWELPLSSDRSLLS